MKLFQSAELRLISSAPTICVCQRPSNVMAMISVATEVTKLNSVVRFSVYFVMYVFFILFEELFTKILRAYVCQHYACAKCLSLPKCLSYNEICAGRAKLIGGNFGWTDNAGPEYIGPKSTKDESAVLENAGL